MVFPQSPRLIFEHNTLSEVIWQLRFPKILSISAKAPADFQEKVRQTYPLYEAKQVIGIPPHIAAALGQVGMTIDSGVTHRFTTADNRVVLSLADESVSVSTSKYVDWNELRPHIDMAFDVLCQVYQPPFFTRVGLRYVNLIRRSKLKLDGVPWKQLINPEWLGPLVKDEISANITQFKSSTVIKLGNDDSGVATVRFGLENKDTFRIDSDFSLEGQINGQKATNIIGDFNTAIGNLFRSAIQPELRTAMGPRNG